MKINRQELIKALEAVRPGLANKEMIEQSTSFAFKNGRVITYNDEISISHPVEGLDIEGAIRADEFYQFLNKTNKKSVELEVNESEIRMKAGRAKAGVRLQNEITLPLEEMGEVGKWKKIPDGMMDSIKFTTFSCSKDMSKPILTCVHIDSKNQVVESSDSYRLTKVKLDKKVPVKSFLFPATSAQELSKYDVTHIAEGKGWVHFKTESDTTFSCRVFEDEFPDTSQFYKVKGEKVALPKKIEEILDRAEIFSKKEHYIDEEIKVTIEDKKIKIRAEHSNGWFEEETKIKHSGNAISFVTHPAFLKDICQKARECVISDDRLKFTGDNWEHVVSLFEEEKGK